MYNDKINEFFARIGTKVIIRFRFLFLALVALLFIFGLLGMDRLVFDSSNESFFPESDDLIIQNNRFQDIFGNEEFIFILVESDDLFSHETLGHIRSLCDDLRENLPFVDEVTSLTGIEHIEAAGDTLEVKDLVGAVIPTEAEALEEIRRKSLSKPIYVDRILSKDARKTGIFIGFERIPDHVYLPVAKGFSPLEQAGWPPEKVIMADRIHIAEPALEKNDPALRKVADPRKLIAPALNVIMNRHDHGNFTITATGMPALDFEIDRITEQESTKFGLIALVVSVVLMIALFRNVSGVVAPFLVVAATLVVLYGIMGWLGFPLTLVSTVVSTLILVISISYSIHVINHLQTSFRKTGSRSASVEYAYFHATWPCFVTALTTSLGFASFLLVPIKPIREMGILCSFGVFLTYLLVMILVPVVFSFGRDRDVRKPAAADSPRAGAMETWADLVTQRPLALGLISLAVVAMLVTYTLRIKVDTDLLETLGNKIRFVRDAKHIVQSLGGLYSYEVLIVTPENGMAKHPEVLKAAASLAEEINGWDSTVVTTSLVEIVKDIHMTMNQNRPEYYRLPSSRELVAQYLLLYEMSGGENLQDWVDYDYRNLRISVQINATSTTMTKRFQEITSLAEKLFPEGTQIRIVGEAPLMMRMVNLLSRGQIKSITAAFGVITLVMILILGSVRVGLLSMIPNALPVLVIGAIMGLFDIPLDMVTVMVMPMIIGIAVDDTVHYIVHFKQEFRACGLYREANRRTFQKVGRAILFTSVILSLGFLIFGLSDMSSLVSMAILSSAGILAALVADLVVTPPIFVFLKPFGKEKGLQ